MLCPRSPCAMLSSLGVDSKISARSIRNGSTKFVDMPRGFSVHVFKNSTSSTHPYNTVAKPEPPQDRASGGGFWQKPTSYASRSNFERKPSLTPSVAYRITQPAVYEIPFDSKRSKSSKNYTIYPGDANDAFIYERSFSSASDALASSPSSSSSDSEVLSESAVSASLEISSTRASSSTETLETTALAVQYAVNPARPALPRAGSASDWDRITPEGARIYPPGLSANPNIPQRAGGIPPTLALAPRTTTVETLSDSDSDTFIGDEVSMTVQRRPSNSGARVEGSRDQRPPAPPAEPLISRRYSDDQSAPQPTSRTRASSDAYRNAPVLPASSVSIPSLQYRQDASSNPRAPPGLSSTATKATDGRDPRTIVASAPNSFNSSALDARRVAQPVPLTRTISNNLQPDAQATSMMVPRSEAKSSPPSASRPITRELSARPEVSAPLVTSSDGGLTMTTRRSVRWTEDLMCPCPIPRSERRKGWFNRRGDQLWTNDGRYKSPDVEYPADLTGYPEPGAGWMNEEGVRIDMEHRLVPKPPLRSALKRPKVTAGTQ